MAVKSLKCLTCGGDLLFNPTLQKWKCEWCDSEFTEKDLGPAAAETTGSDAVESYEHADNPDVKVYKCSYCGAEVVTDNVTAATFCVYCQRPIVVGSQFSGAFKPDFVVPFKNTKDQALKSFKDYLKGKRFLPNEYKNDQNIEKLAGVYIPFWLYEGDVGFNVRGEGDIVTNKRQGDYDIKKTDIYEIAREGQIKIENIPVDASTRTPDDLMDSIEPFDFSTLTGFSTNYLSGFLAEKYDEEESKLYERAKKRFEGSAENKIRESLEKYSTVRRKVDKKRLDNVKSKYGLLPVWMFNSKFKDKQYNYAMNGQTGKMTGNLPVDGGKIFTFFLTVFVIAALIIGAASVLVLEDAEIGSCVLFGIIGGLIISGISTAVTVGKHKPVAKATHADYYVKDENVKMSLVQDVYLKSTEVKTKVTSTQTTQNKK
ncbi:MAG: hypothetical protein FWD23_12985 [Oscillospiraceae bacterium]|nr:hypothetical protein [Oscillospiraceae bacterium]